MAAGAVGVAFAHVEVAFGAQREASRGPSVADLPRPFARAARLAARFGRAGLGAGGGGMPVGAGAGFGDRGRLPARERFGAVFDFEPFDVGAGQGALEGDDVEVGDGAVGAADRLGDAHLAARPFDRFERVQGGLDFFAGGAVGELSGLLALEGEPEGPLRGAHPNFLGLVHRPGRDVPADRLDQPPPGGVLLDPVVGRVGDEEVAGVGVRGEALKAEAGDPKERFLLADRRRIRGACQRQQARRHRERRQGCGDA